MAEHITHMNLTIGGVVSRVARTVLLSAGLVIPLGAQRNTAMAPPTPARMLVAQALETARAEHKMVLVEFGASWCGPCHQLTAFLQAPVVGALMRDNYVIVALTALELPGKKAFENPGATDLMKAMGGGAGIPFFYFLDATGAKLADSNVEPDGTGLGYPDTPVEIEAFDQLLQKTAPRMTAAQRLQIREYFAKVPTG